MRYRARKDTNQDDIVKALRQMGVSVQTFHKLGDGVPDLLCGFRKRNLLMEIKDGKRSPSEQRLTEDESEWHDSWRGQVCIVRSAEDAVRVMEQVGI